MLFKKCTGCKREFTKEELQKLRKIQKETKEKIDKFACPACHELLITYDESRFQKKWYGYLNNDKGMVEHLFLVEFKYFIDKSNHDSFEVRVPILNYLLETGDFSQAINMPDEHISTYLKDKYKKEYDNEHKILTQAFIQETDTERQNVKAWW